MTNCFIVGCGYVGTKVALQELKDGGKVSALVSRFSSAQALRSLGIDAIVYDLDSATLSPPDLSGSVLYWFAPPPPKGLFDTRIASFFSSIGKSSLPSRLVLISTTGIYGDCRGAWVTESQPARPTTDRAKRRVNAEEIAGHWCRQHGVPAVILRVPGIYGPGRLPVDRLRQNEPVLPIDQSPWSNRIHVVDLVRACVASATIEIDSLSNVPEICNVSDGSPSTTTEFYLSVAKFLGLPSPPILSEKVTSQILDSHKFSRSNDSKRVDNSRMREWLGVVPEFPCLELGLSAVGSPELIAS